MLEKPAGLLWRKIKIKILHSKTKTIPNDLLSHGPHSSTIIFQQNRTQDPFKKELLKTKCRKENIPERRKLTSEKLTKKKKFGPFLDLCVSSLRRGHANLLCIVPILSDVPEGTSLVVLLWYINAYK